MSETLDSKTLETQVYEALKPWKAAESMKAGSLLVLVILLNAGVTRGEVPTVSAADFLAKGDAASAALKYGEALDWYRKAADLGSARAEVEIGQLYALARGVTEDQAAALAWYRKAASQGDADGEFYVGLQYENGWGVDRDYGQALIWYRRSANHGNAVAAEAVGWIYENGLGVTADFNQARPWFDKAVFGGDAAAENGLCGPYWGAWLRVATGKNIAAMDGVIAKIDPYCSDLLSQAKARRDDAKRASQTEGKPSEP